MLTAGSLFSGIGGLDLGFERAGFEIRWQCEADEFCRRALKKHWPDVPCYLDLRRLHADNVEPVDVLIGGFPCQDVSDAGLRTGIDGARSGLWVEYARLIRVLRAKGLRAVAIENVPGLFARGFDRVLGDLAALGLDAEWDVIRAADVRAPHRRARVFIVAYAKHLRCEQRRATYDIDGRDASRHDVDRCDARMEHAYSEGQRNAGEGDERRECDSRRDAIARASERRPFWPARPGEPQHAWEPPRCLESSVGRRADGVSRGLAGWRRAALQAFGNAVVPAVAEVVAHRVMAILRSEDTRG